jgi:dienelactone hydrolase
VARILERAGVGTLLCGLGAGGEERATCDPERLAQRLLAVARWAASEASPVPLPLGILGVGAGAAAAFIAAATEPKLVSAIVARSGGPEMVGPWLPAVRAATLFMVGADDRQGLALAHEAAVRLHGPRRLALVIGAGCHFDEPGTLDHGAHLASAWFIQFFAQIGPPRVARPRWQHLSRGS